MPNGWEVSRASRVTERKAVVALAVAVLACAAVVTALAQAALGPWLSSSTTQPVTAIKSQASAATKVSSATPTQVPPDALLVPQLKALTNLHGRYLGEATPNFADPIMVVFVEESSPPLLSDIQFDAYQVQRQIWTEHQTPLPSNWEVSVEFYVNSTYNTLGTYVATANLHGSSAVDLDWNHLTPQQAWQRYDGIAFNAHGL